MCYSLMFFVKIIFIILINIQTMNSYSTDKPYIQGKKRIFIFFLTEISEIIIRWRNHNNKISNNKDLDFKKEWINNTNIIINIIIHNKIKIMVMVGIPKIILIIRIKEINAAVVLAWMLVVEVVVEVEVGRNLRNNLILQAIIIIMQWMLIKKHQVIQITLMC